MQVDKSMEWNGKQANQAKGSPTRKNRIEDREILLMRMNGLEVSSSCSCGHDRS